MNGDISKKIKLTLAPMAGQGDAVFRRICRRYGADGATSEMISAKGLRYGDASTLALAKITPDDAPLALQIFGHEPEVMAYAAGLLASGEYAGGGIKPSAIDINMGCPVKKIVSNGDGSALMKNISLAASVVSACVRATEPYGVPVTVKLRAGWDAEHINAVELARACEASGASELTVHGRTREMQYSGAADRKIIAAVKRAVSIPVTANGDVRSAADASAMLDETGADNIAVARGALGSPWIFTELKLGLGLKITDNLRETADILTKAGVFGDGGADGAKRAFLCRAAIAHAEDAVAEYGPRGLAGTRPHLSAYLRGFDGAASLRAAALTAEDIGKLRALLS